MPVRQLASNVQRAPGQWQDLNGNVPGAVTSTTFSPLFPGAPAVSGNEQYFLFLPDVSWITALAGSYGGYGPGLVGEIHLSYNTAGSAGSAGPPVVAATIGLPTTLSTVSSSAPYVFKAGQKLYFCVHAIDTVAANVTTSAGAGVSFHLSLSSARAAAGLALVNSAAELIAVPDIMLSSGNAYVSGWTRSIAPGSTVSVVN